MLVRFKELPTLFADGGAPRFVRFLWGVESAEEDFLFTDRQSGVKSPSFTFHSTGKLARWKRSVPKVLRACCYPQIAPAIVCTVAVFVVKLSWFIAGLHLPDDAVSKISHVFYRNKNSSYGIGISGFLPGVFGVPRGLRSRIFKMIQRARFPYQDARLWIINETIAQMFCGWQWSGIRVLGNHRARLHRVCGQGRGMFEASSGPLSLGIIR